jgi:hypothetical protein
MSDSGMARHRTEPVPSSAAAEGPRAHGKRPRRPPRPLQRPGPTTARPGRPARSLLDNDAIRPRGGLVRRLHGVRLPEQRTGSANRERAESSNKRTTVPVLAHCAGWAGARARLTPRLTIGREGRPGKWDVVFRRQPGIRPGPPAARDRPVRRCGAPGPQCCRRRHGPCPGGLPRPRSGTPGVGLGQNVSRPSRTQPQQWSILHILTAKGVPEPPAPLEPRVAGLAWNS